MNINKPTNLFALKRFFKGKLAFVVVAILIIVPVFNAGAQVQCPSGNWDNSTGVCIPTDTGLPEGGGDTNPVGHIINNVMLWLLGVVGFIAIIAFVVSGIQYLTSAGDESQIETAKRNMKWSIVGVIVALIGYIVIVFINDMLGGSSGSGWGNSGSTATNSSGSSTTSNGNWIDPDTGQPFNDSVSRGRETVNQAIQQNENANNSGDNGLPVPSQ